MKDYSLLFNQGLFSIAAERTVAARRPVPRLPRHVNGRSFLNLKTSRYADEGSFKHTVAPMTSTGVSFNFTAKQVPTLSTTSLPRPSSPGSPTRRALPLPKPAPLSSLPAIPVSSPIPPSPVTSSVVVTSPSSRKHRKHSSLSPSFFSVRTHASEAANSVHSGSSGHRKRRRQDALHALEGKRRGKGRSFMPSIKQELEDDEDSVTFAAPPVLLGNIHSHLSFGSTGVYPFLLRTPNSDSSNQAVFSARPSLLRSPTTPCFSVSFPTTPVDPPLLRRASTGTSKVGWGINFIDLEDDCASSLWRWSHVA